MKKYLVLISAFLLVILLTSCQEKQELIRIELLPVEQDGHYGDEIILSHKDTIIAVGDAFSHIKWEPNTKPHMARQEVISLILYYKAEDDMPEILYNYKIWFNDNGTSTIISDKEDEGFGNLDKGNTDILKENLTLK